MVERVHVRDTLDERAEDGVFSDLSRERSREREREREEKVLSLSLSLRFLSHDTLFKYVVHFPLLLLLLVDCPVRKVEREGYFGRIRRLWTLRKC